MFHLSEWHSPPSELTLLCMGLWLRPLHIKPTKLHLLSQYFEKTTLKRDAGFWECNIATVVADY